MRVWLDDIRVMPPGFDKHVFSAYELIELIKDGQVSRVSLDHDLGPEDQVGNGYMVAKAIEECAFFGLCQRITWEIHSQNTVGAASMRKALENADRYWDAKEA